MRQDLKHSNYTGAELVEPNWRFEWEMRFTHIKVVVQPWSKISMISEISVVRKHGNIDGNIGILSISIKIAWKPQKL
ncbi:hypothetical protein KJ032_26430, partial [Salmonella enterica subsp. enterica serovar Typhimurium]|nr:hypothetical protein [Salmonella enterica subsp. enterica serovar Typhimurium]